MGSLEQEQVLDSQLHAQTSASGLRDQHNRELENLTLANQPLKTANFFFFAVIKCLKKLSLNTIVKFSCLVLISVLSASGILLLSFGRPSEETLQPVQELLSYLRFGLWWLALGVASSIGLGSGLHTFVLYLGPHIALFTLKSVSCGRVDLKSAPYDTIQLRSGPSWLDKNCSEYGPPLFSTPSARVPWTSILSQVQLEAILWGIGTALGELPPYFISRAAFISGNERELVEDIDSSSKEDSGIFSIHLKKMEQWLLSQRQYLNFFTILALASVPNPLFDLAGIMCGQFGIPFWKFFAATLLGKAIIKTHIQTVFIISVCNNQLLDLIENQLVRVLTLIPGVASLLPNIISKLHIIREKYMAAPHPVSAVKAKKWDLSLGSLWNTIVWLMLLNFSAKIINATAKGYLRELQEKELAVLENSQVRG